MKKMLFALAALALLGGQTARAQPELDFSVKAGVPSLLGGPSISYAGGSADLVGKNLAISSVQGLGGTPLNNLVSETISKGSLNFTTGGLTSSTSNFLGSTWNFGAGSAGSFTIKGGISALGIAANTTLLTGQMESATVSAVLNGPFQVAISLFVNTVNSKLASAFGLSGGSSAWSGGFNISFLATGVAPSSIGVSTVLGGDVITHPTPEPSSLAIGGIGALGLIGYGLRRRKNMGV